jgi:hypothetical protein
VSESIDDYELHGAADAPGRCPGRFKGRTAGHRIEIAAPPELVWDIVSDFEGWPSWNPLYIATRGHAEPGGTLRFSVRLEGMKPQNGTAHVVTVRPGELLEYRISGLGGLVRNFRFVEIEELSPTRCAVTNGEVIGGPLGGLLFKAMGMKVGKGLEGMNLALRSLAERKWNGQRG